MADLSSAMSKDSRGGSAALTDAGKSARHLPTIEVVTSLAVYRTTSGVDDSVETNQSANGIENRRGQG